MREPSRSEYRSTLCTEDIRKWLEFNVEVNSNPKAEFWLSRAFAFCKEQLGILEEPSRTCSLVHAGDYGDAVGGVIVSSDKAVLACVSVGPGGVLGVDHGITRTFQRMPPDHVVALLWECESLALTRSAMGT